MLPIINGIKMFQTDHSKALNTALASFGKEACLPPGRSEHDDSTFLTASVNDY